MIRCIHYAGICLACLALWLPGYLLAMGIDLPLDSSPINREDPKYLTSYAPILKPAKEAVVAVHSASILRVYRQRGVDPREELLRRYFGLPRSNRNEVEELEQRSPEGVGSGVVISSDGYILTNNHVISARDGGPADEILVELNDGRELAARLVGRDPLSDLAVLKVEADDLPFLPVADSDLLEVGDVVFAIGNPMGIGLTITQGIVSATGRDNLSILGDAGYESFIQTDAPINPGNSGGALVDAYGRLVGINTAILSRSGGSIGLGFAIPSTFARTVALALIQDGEVRRGVLGVNIEDFKEAYSEAFQVPGGAGVLIHSVIEGLPAAIAGLRKGDVVVSVNGVPVRTVTELRIQVAVSAPGETIRVGYYREGRAAELDVILADPNNPYGTGALRGELLEGVEVAVIDQAQREKFGLESRLCGLVVLSASDSSPYAEAFPEGAVLLEVNGVRPESVDHARELLAARKVSRIYIFFKGRAGYLSIRPE